MTEESVSAGALLQQRREALGLTTAQVAQQLNLKTTAIEQIEALQFDGSVAPTFIRGYLKLYARLLKLNERQVLSQFEPYLQAATQPVAMHSFSRRTSRDAAENRFKLATYFLAVLLIGLLLVWFWQTHLLDNEPVLSVNNVSNINELTGRSSSYQPPVAAALPIASTANPANASAQPAIGSDQTAPVQPDEPASLQASTTSDPALNTEQNPPATQPATATPPAVTTGAATAVPSERAGGETTSTATVNPTPTAAPAADVNATETSAATEAGTTTPGTATPEAAEQPAVSTSVNEPRTDNAAGVSVLALSFTAQCWLEVTDAAGKRLAYQMAQAGQQLQLQGQLPFKVVLGDATAVQLSRDGQPVDLSAYQPGRPARLTLTGSN